MSKTVLLLIVAGAAWWLLRKGGALDDPEDDPNYEEADMLDRASGLLDDVTDFMGMGMTQTEQNNASAFLWMIRINEGTADNNGYSTLVGGGQFDSFADHPRVLVALPRLGIKSSAAGAYQILRRTWDEVAKGLGLPDFSPQSQDRAAVKLIRQRGALGDVRAGRFGAAVEKCRKEWASLPGAGYGQHKNNLAYLQSAYESAGYCRMMVTGGAVAAVVVFVLARKAAGVVGEAVGAINPFNTDNIINQGVTSVYQTVTGSTGTIGTDIYDATHGGALDMTSKNNAAYSSVSAVGEWITGEKGWNLGGAIYDWTH